MTLIDTSSAPPCKPAPLGPAAYISPSSAPQARTELLALIGQLYASLRSRFDAEDTATVFVWVEVRA